MIRRTPRSTRTDTLFPYTTLFRSIVDAAQALGAGLVLKVRAPDASELPQMKSGSVLIGMLDPFDQEGLARLAGAGLTAFALEAAPRITRAQSLDVLSSQANLAGYKAVQIGRRRVGKECVRTCRSRWWPYHHKNKKTN